MRTRPRCEYLRGAESLAGHRHLVECDVVGRRPWGSLPWHWIWAVSSGRAPQVLHAHWTQDVIP